LQVALGDSSGETDQGGALQTIGAQSGGKFLLILIIIGIFVVLRLGTLRASLSVLIVVALLDAAYLVFGLGTQEDFVVYQLIMMTAFAIGFFSNYIYERQRRVTYLGRRAAEQQAARLEQALRRAAEAQMQAEQAARVKSDFVAHVSHELRTPLNAVIGFAEMLQSEAYGPLGDDHYKDYAGLIRQAGQHLLEVINSILDLSRIEAGKMTLTLDRLKVVDEADAVISLLLTQARQKELSLVMDASLHGLPALDADRSAFRQVLLNLISNAIKFTPAEGRIVVSGATEKDTVRISISDDGPGIAAADLVRLGEAFYQAGPKNQRRQGSGLGLAISHRLMALHGGRLKIASELGRGTTATMIFPCKQD